MQPHGIGSQLSLAAALAVMLFAAVTQAATFAVDSTTDAVDSNIGNGVCATAGAVCTLRAAIQETNALAGADTITLPAGTYTLTLAGSSENAAATGDLDVTDSAGVTITGDGMTTTIIDAGGLDRVLDINTITAMTDLTITNGNCSVLGGGIYLHSGASATLTRVTVSSNTSGGYGGGIAASGTLTLNDVHLLSNSGTGGGGLDVGATTTFNGGSVVGNTTSGLGAGINVGNSASLTFSRGEISQNTSTGNYGGGIYSTGSVTLTNVTVSGNTCASGAGMHFKGTLYLTNVTVYGNITGMGLQKGSGGAPTTAFTNTIIAGNAGGNCSTTFTSTGYNLESTTNTCGFTGTGDQNSVSAANLNIGALANNGGSTQTHALLVGSVAINAGTSTGAPATDQRGVPRPQGSGYEIGAYEFVPPSSVRLVDFTAASHRGEVLLRWTTSFEADNLGFHIYREDGGKLLRLTPSLIGGSSLLAGEGPSPIAGRPYVWWDHLPESAGASRYYLEDVDLHGKRTLHGPIVPVIRGEPFPRELKSELLSELGVRLQENSDRFWRVRALEEKLAQKPTQSRSFEQHPRLLGAPLRAPAREPLKDLAAQWSLAGMPGVKLSVKKEGWYRMTQPELVTLGLNPSAHSRRLKLFVGGREQAIRITGEQRPRFGPRDAIEFYGVGLDTPSTDKNVYWLVESPGPGKRLDRFGGKGRASASPSFSHTVEDRARTVYFAALNNGAADNFFGPILTQKTEISRLLNLPNLTDSFQGAAQLEVALQGVTSVPHRVRVSLNKTDVGEVLFVGKSGGSARLSVPHSLLLEGDNIVGLVAEGGDLDVSLLDCVKITYQHAYAADDDALKFTAQGGTQLSIGGFSNPRLQVFDITNPSALTEAVGSVDFRSNGYSISFKVPGKGQRTLLAMTRDSAQRPASVAANHSSHWNALSHRADFIIIAPTSLLQSATRIETLREKRGWEVAVVDIEDIYDEFSFGTKSPDAVQRFLQHTKDWALAPRFLLLFGDASFDPRNFLGFGDFDLVPTKLVNTTFFETASDDGLADFNDDGLPELAVGRLPARTATEAEVLVDKLLSYEPSANVSRAKRALFVADKNDGFDFEDASRRVEAALPAGVAINTFYRGQSGPGASSDSWTTMLDGEPFLVNYFGHGSVGHWAGPLLTTDRARSLSNSALPVFSNMTCLNGMFHDLYTESLGEALLKAEHGGAIAVWASSTLTSPPGQLVMDEAFVRHLFAGKALGEAARQAKGATTDLDVRRSWILLGDPTLFGTPDSPTDNAAPTGRMPSDAKLKADLGTW